MLPLTARLFSPRPGVIGGAGESSIQSPPRYFLLLFLSIKSSNEPDDGHSAQVYCHPARQASLHCPGHCNPHISHRFGFDKEP